MPRFSAFSPTMTVTGAYKTVLGIKFANTTGHRGRLRSCLIYHYNETPADDMLMPLIVVTNNATDGTSSSVTAAKYDENSVASLAAAIGGNYTVEPTTIQTPHKFEAGFNIRGTFLKEWAPGEGIEWGPNQTLLLQLIRNVADRTCRAILEWEEF